MNFRVGQRVVCIAKSDWYQLDTGCITPGGPTLNNVYTVSGIDTQEPFPALYLDDDQRNLWDARYFRPAVEPDISVFTAMLNKSRTENKKASRIPRVKRVKEDA